MNENLKYIEENFIEISELAAITNFSVKEIEEFIEKQLIPSYSYLVTTDLKITSPLEDNYSTQTVKKYFAKTTIMILQNLKNNPAYQLSLKKDFKETFIKKLNQHKYKAFAYNNIFENDNDKLNEIFEEEWKAYCDGIYGICTLNATESEIVDKEISVKRLMHFNEKYKNQKLTDEAKAELLDLCSEFDKVAARFAPYQRQNSSRGKYIDKILAENGMSEFIKNYD